MKLRAGAALSPGAADLGRRAREADDVPWHVFLFLFLKPRLAAVQNYEVYFFNPPAYVVRRLLKPMLCELRMKTSRSTC